MYAYRLFTAIFWVVTFVVLLVLCNISEKGILHIHLEDGGDVLLKNVQIGYKTCFYNPEGHNRHHNRWFRT